MSEIAIIAGFFLFVMAGVMLAGYVLGEREEKTAGPSILDEPELPGTHALLAQAFRLVGESFPGGTAPSNPTRSECQLLTWVMTFTKSGMPPPQTSGLVAIWPQP